LEILLSFTRNTEQPSTLPTLDPEPVDSRKLGAIAGNQRRLSVDRVRGYQQVHRAIGRPFASSVARISP
jgi:hypothetical protein